MVAALAAACAALGLAAGGVANIVIDRVPARESLRDRPRRCRACGHGLRGAELIPVWSWSRHRGGCSQCGERLGARYPLVEVGTAALFAAAAVRFGTDWALPAYLLFFVTLVALSVIDLDHFLIPNRIVYPALFATAPLLGVAALAERDAEPLVRAAVAGALAWGFLLMVWFVNPKGMGFGDVRLALLIGIYGGWISYEHALLAILLGFFIAAIIGILLLATRRKGRKDHVPFGPFLAAGAVAAVLFGTPILDWWLGR